MDSKNNHFKNRNFFQSVRSALLGLINAFKEERNLKIDLMVLIIILLISFFFKFSLIETIIIYLNWSMIVSLEIINTVFERLIDLTLGTKYNDNIKKLKDMAAAAVFFASITLVLIIGGIMIAKIGNIFYEK